MSGSQRRGFIPIEDKVTELPQQPDLTTQQGRSQAVAAQMVMIGIAQLGKRAVVAASHLFTAAMVGSAFWLWYTVLPSPNVYQLIGLAGYAAFILLVEIVRRRG